MLVSHPQHSYVQFLIYQARVFRSVALSDSVVKNLAVNAGDIRDWGLIPGSGRSPGGGNDNLLQYSCLENSMDRGAWQATVHGVTKSWNDRAHAHTYWFTKIA